MVDSLLATAFLRNRYIVALSSMRCTSFSCIKISTVSAHLPSFTFHACTKQTYGGPHSQLLKSFFRCYMVQFKCIRSSPHQTALGGCHFSFTCVTYQIACIPKEALKSAMLMNSQEQIQVASLFHWSPTQCILLVRQSLIDPCALSICKIIYVLIECSCQMPLLIHAFHPSDTA